MYIEGIASFIDCTFSTNTAWGSNGGRAGAVFVYGSGTFTDCTFLNNRGEYEAGAVYTEESTSAATFNNCYFDGNQPEDIRRADGTVTCPSPSPSACSNDTMPICTEADCVSCECSSCRCLYPPSPAPTSSLNPSTRPTNTPTATPGLTRGYSHFCVADGHVFDAPSAQRRSGGRCCLGFFSG